MWWKDYENEFIKMLEYISTIKRRHDLSDFFSDYKKETTIKMIFESNTIEGEGVNLESTKKMYSYSQGDFSHLNLLTENRENLEKVVHQLSDKIIIKYRNDMGIAQYQGKEKDILATVNHIITLGILENFFSEKDFKDIFLSEEGIKNIHWLISQNLKNNNNGKPGEYRKEGALINIDTVFTPPSLIEASMKNALKKLHENLEEKNIFLGIFSFVPLFIRIHPFGDFNGRISRIILNFAFRMNEVPFYVVLRSNSKDKTRYIYSMKEYYKSRKIDKFISIVSKTFNRQVEEEINNYLIDAGIPIILPTKFTQEEKEAILKDLKKL